MLPFLVAAMTFLGALSLAGAVAASSLARSWRQGAGSALTVQVPRPTKSAEGGGASRLERVLELLRASPEIASARALSDDELADLLRPWLGAGIERLSIPLPAVIEVQLADAGANVAALARRLEAAAPGVSVESHGAWLRRLTALARSVQVCAGMALLVTAAVAVAVVTAAVRAGLSARREAIELVHALGATDSYIAGRFSRRATRSAALGGVVGAFAAMPVLLVLANLASPFTEPATSQASPGSALTALPAVLWLIVPGMPAVAGAIGFATAQVTVRRWLRRLP